MSLKKIPEDAQNLFSKKPYLKLYFQTEENKDFQVHPAKFYEEYYVSYQNRPLASITSPKKQAERLLSEKNLETGQIVILLGLGNPHLITEINKKMEHGQIFLLIDYHSDIVPTLWEFGLGKVLSLAGRHVFAGEEKLPLLWNYIESLPIEKLKGIVYFKNPTSLLLAKEFYSQVEENIHKLFSSKMSDLLTKFEFERIWVKNTILNTFSFQESSTARYKVSELFGMLENIPAVLVSAGPSLRSQCNWLKSIRDKVFVFSCDTSLKVLLKFGILPDGVMTLDAQTNSFFHFMGENLEEVTLFADLVTSPMLLRSLNFKSIVHSQTTKFQVNAAGEPIRETTAGSEIAEMYIGNVGDIQSGGSVATSAFDLLRMLGCKEIYLLGQDLAYTGREIHSTGTHHNEKWLTLVSRKKSLEHINESICRKRQTQMVEASDGGKVLTDYVLNIYRHWFEESAKHITFPVYNISLKGARIQNIPSIDTNTATHNLSKYKEHGYPWRKKPPWKKIIRAEKTSELRKEFLYQLNLLGKVLDSYQKSKMNEEQILEAIDLELMDKPYLASMIRKTKIYLKRHSNLSLEHKKELLFQSLKKEIRFLKRAILAN
jgi:hypothetical protein